MFFFKKIFKMKQKSYQKDIKIECNFLTKIWKIFPEEVGKMIYFLSYVSSFKLEYKMFCIWKKMSLIPITILNWKILNLVKYVQEKISPRHC